MQTKTELIGGGLHVSLLHLAFWQRILNQHFIARYYQNKDDRKHKTKPNVAQPMLILLSFSDREKQ